MKLIVYGTLKRGHGNNRLLRDSVFQKEVLVPGYKLVYAGGKGSFPYAVPDPKSTARGEMFDVTEDIRRSTDSLEGHPRWYERTPVTTSDGDEAEMYVMHSHKIRDPHMCPDCDIVNNAYEWNR